MCRIKWLVKRGVEVHVGRWFGIREKLSFRSDVINGIFVHGIKFNLRDFLFSLPSFFELPHSYILGPRKVRFLLSYGKGIEKLSEKYNVEIIHAHFAYPEGFAASVAKVFTNKPLVMSVWGYDVQRGPKSYGGALSRRDTAYLVRKELMAADVIIVGAESHYKTVIQLIGEEEV